MKKFTSSLLTLMLLLTVGSSLSAQAPFWSEDFDNQLPADWTAIMAAGNGNATSNWVWTNSGPAGTYSIGPLASTSAANGWMLFDSDLNCSGNQDVWLVSPKLDLSARDVVVLEFETHYRRFNDSTALMVSTDSITWTTVPVFGGYTNGQFADGTSVPGDAINPYTVTANLTANAANEPEFWFAFRFLADPTTVIAGTDIGCGYSWQIDDVALYDADQTPAIDLALGQFFYPPASYAQPVSQIKSDTMSFFAVVSNVGGAEVTNVVLKAEVRQGANTIWVDTLLIPVLDTSALDTFDLPNIFVPENLAEGNNYSIRYQVYSLDGADEDMSNNTKQEGFIVTDFLYSKEAGATTALRPGGDPADWAVANVYRTSTNWVEQYKATKASMRAIKNTADGGLAGNTVAIALVEIDDNIVDAGWNGFDDAATYVNNTSMIIKSINLYEFTQTGTDATISQDLIDFNEEVPGVVLEPGKRYMLIAEYQGTGNNLIFHAFSEEISYWFQISTAVYTDKWYLGGFQGGPAAVLRMDIDLYNIADEVSLPDNSLNFYPNPANTNLKVDISLDEPTLANITIADLNGRVIQIDEVENAYQQTRQYDVSKFANGTYIVRIATKQGTKTKKFVVQH